MARQVRWTRLAVDDLEQAADYIGRDSPSYAQAVVRRIFSSAQSLKTFPERGAVVEELEDQAIRQIFVSGYRIIYMIQTERLFVLGVIHARRDFSSAFDPNRRLPPK